MWGWIGNGSIEYAAARLMKRHADSIWKYLDKAGRLLFAVARWNEEAGDKTYRPLTWVRRPDGRTEWALQHLDSPRPLYGLDQIALSPLSSVVIVEGEKSVDAARGVFPSSVIVTSPGGCNAVEQADWSVLNGRPRALIWGDADDAGEKYARDVARLLSRLGIAEILVVDSAGLASITPDGTKREAKKGWDVADAVADGWPSKKLRKAVLAHAAKFDPGPSFISFGPFQMTEKGLTADIEKGAGAKGTHIAWRTLREQTFRISGRNRFRMTPRKTIRERPNMLWLNNFSWLTPQSVDNQSPHQIPCYQGKIQGKIQKAGLSEEDH
jgi:hypothetical protein